MHLTRVQNRSNRNSFTRLPQTSSCRSDTRRGTRWNKSVGVRRLPASGWKASRPRGSRKPDRAPDGVRPRRLADLRHLRVEFVRERHSAASSRKRGGGARRSRKPPTAKTETGRPEQELSLECKQQHSGGMPLSSTEASVCKGKSGSQTKRRDFNRLRGIGSRPGGRSNPRDVT